MREIVRWITALLGTALLAYVGLRAAGEDVGLGGFFGDVVRGEIGGEATAAAPLAVEIARSLTALLIAGFASTAIGLLLGVWWGRFRAAPWRPAIWLLSLFLRAVPALAVGAVLFWAIAVRGRAAFPNLLEPDLNAWDWRWSILTVTLALVPGWSGIVASRARAALDGQRGKDRTQFLRSLGLGEASIFYKGSFPFAAYAVARDFPRQLPWQIGWLCLVEYLLRMGGFGGHILREFVAGGTLFVAAGLIYTTAAVCAVGSLFELLRSRVGESFSDPGGQIPWTTTTVLYPDGKTRWKVGAALGALILLGTVVPRASAMVADRAIARIGGEVVAPESASIIAAAYSSLGTALLTVLMATAVGVLLGVMGGRVRKLSSRTASESLWVLLTPPALLVLAALAPPTTTAFVLIAGTVLGAAVAHPIALALRGFAAAPFLRPAAASGAAPLRSRLRHAAPYALPILARTTAAQLPAAILLESAAGFLGLAGTSGENARPSLGMMIAEGHRLAFDGNLDAVAAGCYLACLLLGAYLVADLARALHRSATLTNDHG